VKKLLLLASAAVVMAACSEAPTAPAARTKSLTPSVRNDDEITCRSGYIVAYDENGNPYCVPDPNGPDGNAMSGGGTPTGGPAVPPP
jgi:hypothetical protein